MHPESNALQQRFAPQPLMRSSWLQLVIVGLTFLCHARAHTSSVMLGLGVDSWRERAISEVRGLRDERDPTQLGIYTGESVKVIFGSSPNMTGKRPRMTSLFPSLPGLFFFLSLSDLIRQSPKKTQGTASQYARRKQRASTKVRAAAIDAVKLATACVIQDFQKTCNFCTRHPLYKLFKLRLEPLSPHNTHNFPE